MTTLGTRLRALRGATSQADEAAALDLAPSTLGTYERDESDVPAGVVVAVCRRHSVSADYVLGLSDHPLGLRPGDWIVDLDAKEARLAGAKSPDSVAASVPARYEIITAAEAVELQRSLRLVRKKKG